MRRFLLCAGLRQHSPLSPGPGQGKECCKGLENFHSQMLSAKLFSGYLELRDPFPPQPQ